MPTLDNYTIINGGNRLEPKINIGPEYLVPGYPVQGFRLYVLTSRNQIIQLWRVY
jgi:hypothetical protein